MGSNIVVIAEHGDGRVKPVTYEIIAFARKLQRCAGLDGLQVLLLTDETDQPARVVADRAGVDVTVLQIPGLTGYNGEIYTRALAEFLAKRPAAFVCTAHTSQGSDYAPALAMKLGAGCFTGVGQIVAREGNLGFARPMFGGKIVARLRPVAKTSVITIQPGVFKPDANAVITPGNVKFKPYSTGSRNTRSLGVKPADADSGGIGEARVIVAAGRGIGEEENLEMIHRLAALFSKAAVAGSRILCDMGWLEYQRQVGVTGATVSPRLYIACGISGAIQHVMGMQRSEFVVAINKDPSAAIFQVADICVVEDLTAFIPTFIECCQKVNHIKS